MKKKSFIIKFQPMKIKHKSCWYHRNLKSFVVALVACLTVCTLLGQEPPQQPNIIVILADDMGYGDVSFNGCPDYTTPNIDSIASNGVLCTNGYVTHPICSPSRAGLLTGRYQERL